MGMEIYIFVPNQIFQEEGDEANGIPAYTETKTRLNLGKDSGNSLFSHYFLTWVLIIYLVS